ncbi:MAG: hypothetical protein K0M58_00855 [Thiobacillus sp.]|nr:hypothetical protein [Thiobacillus sp.]
MLNKQSETLFEPTATVNQVIETKGESIPTGLSDFSATKEAARCLEGYVSAHDDGTRLFRFLSALAAEVLADLNKGGAGEVATIKIHNNLYPHGAKEDASNRVSGAWNDWVKKSEDRLIGLQDYAANQGLDYYPWPMKKGDSKGGFGRHTHYAIEVRPIGKQALESQAREVTSVPYADIRYIRETTPKPAWWASWFFSKEFHLAGWRRILFLTPAILMLIAALGVFLVVWFTLSHQQAIPPSRILVLVATAAAAGYFAWIMVSGVGRLGDKRIIMAPDILIGFREYGVQLELTRIDSTPRAASRLGLVRYAATCPICGAKVQVESGGREFHGRLVGRCQESPDEHVFSFDRVTRSGKYLRATSPH